MQIPIPEEMQIENKKFKYMEKFDDDSIKFLQGLDISEEKLNELVKKLLDEAMEAQKQGRDLKAEQLERMRKKEAKQKNRDGSTVYLFCNICLKKFDDCECNRVEPLPDPYLFSVNTN